MSDKVFRTELLGCTPHLRAFAMSLCGNSDRADDLVQETLMRAWTYRDRYQPDTNLPAWTFTILRNLFLSDYRKRKREVEDGEGKYAATLKAQPSQVASLEFKELKEAFAKLPKEQREALHLVGVQGLSYEEAAKICDCAVGTIKSRVNRARTKLAEMLQHEAFESDAVVESAVQAQNV